MEAIRFEMEGWNNGHYALPTGSAYLQEYLPNVVWNIRRADVHTRSPAEFMVAVSNSTSGLCEYRRGSAWKLSEASSVEEVIGWL